MTDSASVSSSLQCLGVSHPALETVLTPDVLVFLTDLERRFGGRRRALIDERIEVQKSYDAGAVPDFSAATKDIREGDWKVAPIPDQIRDRRVEITGPVDRKMIINALNSGAKVFMADFEDATTPSWNNLLSGQQNMIDLWRGCIDFTDPKTHKAYRVGDNPATLMIRPRGWQLPEAHLTLDGVPMSGSLFDFGIYAFHNARAMIDQGYVPCFYLPKMESWREAELWADVFAHSERVLGLGKGAFRATVLIETLPAAFQMDEILYALRDNMLGLNCGRWDYIFSYIKRLAQHPDRVLPDRVQVGMGDAFLRAYSLLLIKTCHRRGAFAMGGMAAQIPIRNDAEADARAREKVVSDKEREVTSGHDGTWVAHPALVELAMKCFDDHMPGDNQIDRLRDDITVSREDLLRIHEGTRSEDGLRENIRVGLGYITGWLGGRGAVPLYHLMEDVATAEICRTQLWQWRRHGVDLDNGARVDDALLNRILDEESAALRESLTASGPFEDALELFRDLILTDDCAEFLTLSAYEHLTKASLRR